MTAPRPVATPPIPSPVSPTVSPVAPQAAPRTERPAPCPPSVSMNLQRLTGHASHDHLAQNQALSSRGVFHRAGDRAHHLVHLSRPAAVQRRTRTRGLRQRHHPDGRRHRLALPQPAQQQGRRRAAAQGAVAPLHPACAGHMAGRGADAARRARTVRRQLDRASCRIRRAHGHRRCAGPPAGRDGASRHRARRPVAYRLQGSPGAVAAVSGASAAGRRVRRARSLGRCVRCRCLCRFRHCRCTRCPCRHASHISNARITGHTGHTGHRARRRGRHRICRQ